MTESGLFDRKSNESSGEGRGNSEDDCKEAEAEEARAKSRGGANLTVAAWRRRRFTFGVCRTTVCQGVYANSRLGYNVYVVDYLRRRVPPH